ncbi:hypothetical protein BaRGS_00026229, partial [Batillaria attramentaria]
LLLPKTDLDERSSPQPAACTERPYPGEGDCGGTSVMTSDWMMLGYVFIHRTPRMARRHCLEEQPQYDATAFLSELGR